MLAQNIYNITAEDLGKVVTLIDKSCEVSCMGKGRGSVFGKGECGV
jgi:hypothetical protein